MTTRKPRNDEPTEHTEPTPAPEAEQGWPRTVRTTFRPDEDVTVTEREYTELQVQGVLIEDKGN